MRSIPGLVEREIRLVFTTDKKNEWRSNWNVQNSDRLRQIRCENMFPLAGMFRMRSQILRLQGKSFRLRWDMSSQKMVNLKNSLLQNTDMDRDKAIEYNQEGNW